MTVRVWEAILGALGVIVASVFLFSNVWGLGVAMVSADLLWLLTRVEIVEKPSRPGRYATLRGRLGVLRLVCVLFIYVAVIYGLFIVHQDVSSRTRVALIADLGLAGLAFMLFGELQRGGDDTLKWLVGARAERKVGELLRQFSDRGWLVLHGCKKDRGGDLDHVVCGPNGAYVIETKSYGFRRRDVGQAAVNAWWLRERLSVPWVTGVLCVAGDRPPERRDKVWVVSHDDLVPWLEQQRNQPVNPQHARQSLLPSPAELGWPRSSYATAAAKVVKSSAGS